MYYHLICEPYEPIWNIMIYKDIHTPAPDQQSFIQECVDHYKEKVSATTMIEYACRYILKVWVSKSLSDGMQKVSLERDTVILDMFKSNLYCVLLLEAMGQRIPDDNPRNLSELAKEKPLVFDYLDLSKILSNDFPDILKSLFAVDQKKRGDEYQICTRYTDLFMAILRNLRNAPLTGKESGTQASYQYNMRFYDGCMKAIAPEDKWTDNSFAQYYLFERFFRLNAKYTLFWAECDCSEKRESVSPALLSDCLFSSPLVILPDEILPKLLYKKWSDAPIHERQAHALHFLIKMSSLWFFTVLETLRAYMRKQGIVSPADVNSFFFPEPDDFSEFVKRFKPGYEDKCDEIKSKRNLRETYQEQWGSFAPAEPAAMSRPQARTDRLASISDKSFSRALRPRTIEEWCMKPLKETDIVVDKAIFALLQDML